jgi:hypothetical protein
LIRAKFKIGDIVEVSPNADVYGCLSNYYKKCFVVVETSILTGCVDLIRATSQGNEEVKINQCFLKLVKAPPKPSPKSLLKDGMRVKTRNGLRIVIGDCYYGLDSHCPINGHYDDNLEVVGNYSDWTKKVCEIVSIYEAPARKSDFLNPKIHGKLIWQREEPAKDSPEQQEIKRLEGIIKDAQEALRGISKNA